MNNRDRHNQQSKKKAGEAALKANNHDEAYRLGLFDSKYGVTYYICRLFSEAMDVDKHNAKYRHLLREAKQKHLLATRVGFTNI